MVKRAGTLKNLKHALHQDYINLGKERKLHARLVGLGAGPNYPHKADDGWYSWDDGMEDVLPVVGQGAKAEAISLAANCPRVLCTSPRVDRLAFARHYESACNSYLKNMHAEEELQAVAIDGYYSMGVMKVYMADSVPVLTESSEWMDPGRPYMQRISRSHFVWDLAASRWQYCDYMADRYLVNFDDVVSDTRFGSAIRKKLKLKGPTDPSEIQRTEIWRPKRQDGSEYLSKLFLSDVFKRKEGTICTYVVDGEFNILIDDPLAEVPWDGIETGPFHCLNLGPVPDKITPSSPAQNMELLANAENSLYRKLLHQAMEQRTIILVPSTYSDDEINALRDGEDLTFIRTDAVATPVRVGGADQNNFAYFLNTQEQRNRFGGNTELRLGLGQTADTASQEGLLAQGASRMEGYNQQIFVKFVRGVVQEIARLLFTAKTVSFPMTRQVAPGIVVDDPWREAIEEGSRLGEFRDYDIDIEPYSMAYKSPSQRVMELQQTFAELVPLAPFAQAMGKAPNIVGYLEKKSRLLNNTDINELLMDIAPPPEQAGGSHERTMAPSTGPREYIHKSQASGAGQNPGQQQLAMMSAASADNAA